MDHMAGRNNRIFKSLDINDGEIWDDIRAFTIWTSISNPFSNSSAIISNAVLISIIIIEVE